MQRQPAASFRQEVLDIYDDYAHGRIDRRDYLRRLSMFAVGGLTLDSLLSSLTPNYAWAEQVSPDDKRIQTDAIVYDSPAGGGKIKGLLAWPATGEKFPTVLVIHENRGLNPYIADVTRRLAVAGFLALAPDALSPLGGYPGNDDEGRAMQAKRDSAEMLADFIAGARWLKKHLRSTGLLGAIGFCFGGGMVYQLAVNLPDELNAGVPYYGRQPALDDVQKIQAPLQIHNASLDQRILAGAGPFEQKLKEYKKPYEAYVYENANHGFHNDTTPRFDEQAAQLAWERTLKFFNEQLK